MRFTRRTDLPEEHLTGIAFVHEPGRAACPGCRRDHDYPEGPQIVLLNGLAPICGGCSQQISPVLSRAAQVAKEQHSYRVQARAIAAARVAEEERVRAEVERDKAAQEAHARRLADAEVCPCERCKAEREGIPV